MNPLSTSPAPATDLAQPVLDKILFASDFSAESLTAFHHALKAALVAKSKLVILHLSPDVATGWEEFPGVRETLERWGLLAPGSPREAVPQLGIDVHKVTARTGMPVAEVLRELEARAVDLVVLATHVNAGKASWHGQLDNEPLARRAGQMTLYIPEGVAGFVSARNGEVTLRQILIPIAVKPDPQPAVVAAARLATRLQLPGGTFTLLHVGDPGNMPAVQRPHVPGWNWQEVTRDGEVIQGIVETARNRDAGLIIMSTDGRNGFLDALRGSHSERVLRQITCPLLAVPEGSHAAAALS